MTKRLSYEHSYLSSNLEDDMYRPGTRGEIRKRSSNNLKSGVSSSKISRRKKVSPADSHGQGEGNIDFLEESHPGWDRESSRASLNRVSLDHKISSSRSSLSKGSSSVRSSIDGLYNTESPQNLSSGSPSKSFGDLKINENDRSTDSKRKDLNYIFGPPANYHGPPYFQCRNQTLEKEIVKKNQKPIMHESGPPLKKSASFFGGAFQNNLTDANLSTLFSEGTLKIEGSLISDRILVGGREDSQNLEYLQSMGITHILNVSSQLPNAFPKDIIYYKLMIDDDPQFPIAKFFACASSFIERVERCKGRVLVHCISGVSRSVTLVLAHLMIKHKFTLKEAYRHVKHYRPYIVPNPGFKMALAMYEYEATGSTSVGGEDVPEWDFYEWNTVKISIPKKKSKSDSLCSIL